MIIKRVNVAKQFSKGKDAHEVLRFFGIFMYILGVWGVRVRVFRSK